MFRHRKVLRSGLPLDRVTPVSKVVVNTILTDHIFPIVIVAVALHLGKHRVASILNCSCKYRISIALVWVERVEHSVETKI
jgi:hypothetical protein